MKKELSEIIYKDKNSLKFFTVTHDPKWLKNKKSRIPMIEILEEYLKEKGMSDEGIKDLYNKLRLYGHYRRVDQVKNDLRETVFTPKGNQYRIAQRRCHFARLLYLAHGIPYEIFGFEEGDLFPVNSTVINHETSKCEFLDIRDQKSEHFNKNYTNLVMPYIENAHGLKVYDYLGRGHKTIPTHDLEKYFQAHIKIFEAIEKKLPGMPYTRILGLHIKEEKLDDFDSICAKLVQQCSPELFGHICRCLKRLKEKIFYISDRPSRTYQFAIFDNELKAFIYEEQYRLNNEGNAYPSFLTIQTSEKNANWHNIYSQEIETHIRDRAGWCINPNNLKNGLERAIVNYKEDFNSKKHDSNITTYLTQIINRKIQAARSVFKWDIGYLS